jgi:hypothetical protein
MLGLDRAKICHVGARRKATFAETAASMTGCPCGERFDSHDQAGSYVHRQYIYVARMVRAMKLLIEHLVRAASLERLASDEQD